MEKNNNIVTIKFISERNCLYVNSLKRLKIILLLRKNNVMN